MFNGLNNNLGNLYKLTNAKTRSVCPENFTGEKGKAGMATEGNVNTTIQIIDEFQKQNPDKNAYEAIKSALPLNFITDEDGRLNRAMRYANTIITADVAEILTTKTSWTELSNTKKDIIKSFFNVTAGEMDGLASEYDLIGSAILVLSAKYADIPVADAALIYAALGDAFDDEKEDFAGLNGRVELTETEKDTFVALLKDGKSTSGIAKAWIVSCVTDIPLAEIYSDVSSVINIETPATPGDAEPETATPGDADRNESDDFIYLVGGYYLDADVLSAYLKKEKITATELIDLVYKWQNENNFYVTGTTVDAYTFNPSKSVKYNLPIIYGNPHVIV